MGVPPSSYAAEELLDGGRPIHWYGHGPIRCLALHVLCVFTVTVKWTAEEEQGKEHGYLRGILGDMAATCAQCCWVLRTEACTPQDLQGHASAYMVCMRASKTTGKRGFLSKC